MNIKLLIVFSIIVCVAHADEGQQNQDGQVQGEPNTIEESTNIPAAREIKNGLINQPAPPAQPAQPQERGGKFSTLKSNFYYFAKLNEPFDLRAPAFTFNETGLSWTLGHKDVASRIYEFNQLKRPTEYQCSPAVESCLDLKINSVNQNTIGEYLRRTDSLDGRTSTNTEYDIYAYDPNFSVVCSATSDLEKCIYDPQTQTLTIRESAEVAIQCGATVYNASDLGVDLQIEHHYKDDNKCYEDENRRVKNRNSGLSFDRDKGEIKIHKECLRGFRRGDTSYACTLRRSVENQLDKMYTPDIYRVEIKLNIKYPPERDEAAYSSTQFKVTYQQGTNQQISCPYEGNPVEYIWRIIKSDNSTDALDVKTRNLTIPKSLQIGVYTVQCLAYMTGDTKTMTKPIDFSLNVTRNANADKRNKYFIIGAAVVGGVLLLLIVIVVIVVVSKKKSSRKSEISQHKSRRPKSVEDPQEQRPLN